MKKIIQLRAFTLVELIVVITILAILWTIGFLSFQWYSVTARDSSRVSDVGSISKVLELYKLQEWFFPQPTNSIEISYSGSLAWRQWTFWEDTRRLTQRISAIPLDPLTQNEYTYWLTPNGQEYEIWAISENLLTDTSWKLFQEAYADNAFFSYVRWNYNRQVIVVKDSINSNILYILWVPTLITTESNSIILQDIITNQSFALMWSNNLPSSYADSLPNSQTHSGSISFTPWNTSLRAPLIFSGIVDDLWLESNRAQFWRDLIAYYSNTPNQCPYDVMSEIKTWWELFYVNTLIRANTWGIPGDNINIWTTVIPDNPNEFITVWNFPNDDYEFNFSLKNDVSLNYNFSIDWGDWSPIENIVWLPDSGPTHTYATAWEYTVTVSWIMEWFENSSSHTQDLIRVISMWDMWWKNLYWAFVNNVNLISVDSPGDTSGVDNMQAMFYWATSLESVALLDTSNVLDMTVMFANTSSLKTIPSFNLSKVVDMVAMFQNSAVEEVVFWNAPELDNFSVMFNGANSLKSVVFWNTPKATQIGGMFTSPVLINVTFPSLDSLTGVWWMFYNVSMLETIEFPNVPSLVSVWWMLFWGQELKHITLWNATSLQYTGWMVDNADVIESLTITGSDSLISLAGTFSNVDLNNFTELNISNTSTVTHMWGLLEWASIFNQDLSSWDVTNVSSCDDFDLWANNLNPSFRPALAASCLQ